MTHGPGEIAALLDRFDLGPSRALGQNFVADANTVRRVVRLAGVGLGDHVVEIGAGLGSLTLALAEVGAEVTAVEVDRHLIPALESVLAGTRVRLVEGDARTLHWPDLLAASGRWALVANLPYNLATPLVLDLLAGVPAITTMLVMVQAEVAARLVAPAGSKVYGIPSVKLAYSATGTLVGRVPPTVFIPTPRVESSLVRIVRHDEPPVDVDRSRLFSLVETAFGQRRKMLRRSLAGVLDIDQIRAAGVDPETRPEQLDLAAWAALARQ